MPVAPTYPGVYVEEVPSGVRTITGVATSIAAFVGRAARGPVNEPVTLNSFGDFERVFGGLSAADPMPYAVRDFYLNGGAQAIVVRLFKPYPTNDFTGFARVTVAKLPLMASSPGKWGEKLRVELELLPDGTQFNLTVRDAIPGGAVEVLRNLTLADGVRRLDAALGAESRLLRWSGPWPPTAGLPVLATEVHNVTRKAVDEVSAKELELAGKEKALRNAINDGTQTQSEIDTLRAEVTTATADVRTAEGDRQAKDSEDLTTTEVIGTKSQKTGCYALEKADLFNLLCIPPGAFGGDTPEAVYQAALPYCVERRALLLVDSPSGWSKPVEDAVGNAESGLTALGLSGTEAGNAALFFPRVNESVNGGTVAAGPSGAVAGVMARTDVQRGVWKAPAGIDAAVNGIEGLELILNDGENGRLNKLGINCLRSFPVTGNVVWGSRTLRGADQLGDEYKYVPVRRLALFLEESLYRGTQWVVFEPNDEPLWAQIRLNVGSFMNDLFRQGAFQGTTPREAYLVRCDGTTTTQSDVNHGIVNILVGFAPLKPAEFVFLKIQQMAGQIAT